MHIIKLILRIVLTLQAGKKIIANAAIIGTSFKLTNILLVPLLKIN